MPFGNLFKELTNAGFWMDVAEIFAGFIVADIVLPAIFNRFLHLNLPDELYSVAAVGVFYLAVPSGHKKNFMIGGGVSLIDNLAERFGLVGKIQTAVNG